MQLLGQYLAIDDEGAYRCRRCGHRFCGVDDNWKRHAHLREQTATEQAIQAPLLARADGGIVFRQWFCPGCAVQLDTEIAQRGEPFRWSFVPDSGLDG